MKNDLPVSNGERTEALTWLRNVLTATLEVSPLSYHQKKKTASLLSGIPDWLLARWADALNIDYAGISKQYPDLAERCKSDTGRHLAQHYLESQDAVATANVLEDVARHVVKQVGQSELPVEDELVERQVCGLALAGCTAEGARLAEDARNILSDTQVPNHPLIEYDLAILNGDESKIRALDAALAGGRYGTWAAERLAEFKRYLGHEPPRFIIRLGERTPQWDQLWQRILTGGDDN